MFHGSDDLFFTVILTYSGVYCVIAQFARRDYAEDFCQAFLSPEQVGDSSTVNIVENQIKNLRVAQPIARRRDDTQTRKLVWVFSFAYILGDLTPDL